MWRPEAGRESGMTFFAFGFACRRGRAKGFFLLRFFPGGSACFAGSLVLNPVWNERGASAWSKQGFAFAPGLRFLLSARPAGPPGFSSSFFGKKAAKTGGRHAGCR